VYQEYSFSITVGIFKSVISVILLFSANNLSKFAQGHKIF
jgi:ABC-type polysaccharide transport system permease subunit